MSKKNFDNFDVDPFIGLTYKGDQPPKKEDLTKLIQEYICLGIENGKTIHELGLGTNKSLPSVSEVNEWEETNVEFKRVLLRSKVRRIRLLYEVYFGFMRDFLENPTEDHKDLVNSIDKSMKSLKLFLEEIGDDPVINLIYKPQIPENMWKTYRVKK